MTEAVAPVGLLGEPCDVRIRAMARVLAVLLGSDRVVTVDRPCPRRVPERHRLSRCGIVVDFLREISRPGVVSESLLAVRAPAAPPVHGDLLQVVPAELLSRQSEPESPWCRHGDAHALVRSSDCLRSLLARIARPRRQPPREPLDMLSWGEWARSEVAFVLLVLREAMVRAAAGDSSGTADELREALLRQAAARIRSSPHVLFPHELAYLVPALARRVGENDAKAPDRRRRLCELEPFAKLAGELDVFLGDLLAHRHRALAAWDGPSGSDRARNPSTPSGDLGPEGWAPNERTT